jgi:hypothetical protein
VKIELTPSKIKNTKQEVYSAKFVNESSELMAEIVDAPLDIATRWAEVMSELHEGIPEIKRVGVCFYCGSSNQAGDFCGDCQRVFRT